jgi:hypothetical protein
MKNRDEILKAQQDRMNHMVGSFIENRTIVDVDVALDVDNDNYIAKAIEARRLGIASNFNDSVEKGKKGTIGEIREHGGVRYKKIDEGKWVPVTEGKQSKGQEDSSDKSKEPKDDKGPSSEGKSNTTVEMNDAQQMHFDSSINAVKVNASYLTQEGPLGNFARKAVNKSVQSFVMSMGMPAKDAVQINFVEKIPALTDPATAEEMLSKIAEGLGKKIQAQNDAGVDEIVNGKANKPKTEPRKDLNAIKNDLKSALKQRFDDPESEQVHDKVNNLIAEAAASAGMPYEDAKQYPWTEDSAFGGGDNKDVNQAMRALDEYLSEIKTDSEAESKKYMEENGIHDAYSVAEHVGDHFARGNDKADEIIGHAVKSGMNVNDIHNEFQDVFSDEYPAEEQRSIVSALKKHGLKS